jgi:hypothetical protein
MVFGTIVATVCPLLAIALYLLRYMVRYLVISAETIKLEMGYSSPGKVRTYRRSEIQATEVGTTRIVLWHRGKKIAVLHRRDLNGYLWERVRGLLRISRESLLRHQAPLLVLTFKPVRLQRTITNSVIYFAVVLVLTAVIFHADLFRALGLAVRAEMPIVAIAFVVSRKDVFGLALTENEIEIALIGWSTVLPAMPQRFSRDAVTFEKRANRIVIRSDEGVVGIVRKNSMTAEEWSTLLRNISDRNGAAESALRVSSPSSARNAAIKKRWTEMRRSKGIWE